METNKFYSTFQEELDEKDKKIKELELELNELKLSRKSLEAISLVARYANKYWYLKEETDSKVQLYYFFIDSVVYPLFSIEGICITFDLNTHCVHYNHIKDQNCFSHIIFTSSTKSINISQEEFERHVLFANICFGEPLEKTCNKTTI